MSAKLIELMKITVTGGDAIDNNRLTGKSNTGTYFICSSKDWDNFSKYFNKNIIYFLSLTKIRNYKNLFISNFFQYKDKYPDKMRHFEDICDSLLSYCGNPEIFIDLRKNDSRVFMKFKDNNREIEYALRGILYSGLSSLTFELNKGICLVYPEINENFNPKMFEVEE